MDENGQLNKSAVKRTALLEMPHKVCEYACPSVGLEDMYEQKTGVRLPDYVVMDLSMIGFMYVRQEMAPIPRMVFWGNGTGKAQHRFLEDVIGYRWIFNEGNGFDTAFVAVKASIDADQPVILGLLDMFHLPYHQKMYHRFHVPQHYVLMVGYDLEKDCVYVLDNSRPQVQSLPLQDLKAAWNVNQPGQSKKNTYAVLSFDSQPASLETILRRGLKKRAAWMFDPPLDFMGLPGMCRFAQEFSTWESELSPQGFKASLEHLVMFTCSVVPMPPARLLRQVDKNADPHQAVRNRFAAMLQRYAIELNEPSWARAAESLGKSGIQIGLLTDRVVDALLGDQSALNDAARILPRIVALEEQTFDALR